MSEELEVVENEEVPLEEGEFVPTEDEADGAGEEPQNIFAEMANVVQVMAAYTGYVLACAKDEESTDDDLAFGMDQANARMLELLGLEPDEFGYEWNSDDQIWEA